MSIFKPVVEYFCKIASLDLRSLAFFRMLLGLITLCDLYTRLSDLSVFYTDLGVLTVSDIQNDFWSIHAWSGSVQWVYFIFGLTAVSALFLVVGYKTRYAIIVCCIMTISLHLRNPAVNNAGDQLLRLVLFISLFLPLNGKYSIDKCREVKGVFNSQSNNFISEWVFVYLFQLILVYAIAGYSKFNDTWNAGMGIYYAMNLHTYAKEGAHFLLSFPVFMVVINYVTLFIERVLWVLLFVPFRVEVNRIILVSIFVSFHFGLFLTMELGLFPWVGMLVWIPLIPAVFWDRIEGISFLKRERSNLKNSSFLRQKKSRFSIVLAGVFVVVIIYGNVREIENFPRVSTLDKVIDYSKLTQGWTLFSGPNKSDGWLVFEATLKNGNKVDLMRNGQLLILEKPTVTSASYSNHRYRKFYKSLRSGYKEYRMYYYDWMISNWNTNHDTEQQIQSASFYLMKEDILLDQQFGVPTKVLLFQRQRLR